MNLTEYEKLMAAITPLDLPTLTRLEADIAQLRRQRKAQESGPRPSIKELLDLAWQDLKDLDPEAYWAERDKELEESRNSWAEKEKMLDRERGL